MHRCIAYLHGGDPCHVVLLPVTVGHSGVSDAKHLAYAIREGYVLLTQNYQAFVECLPNQKEPSAGLDSVARPLFPLSDPTARTMHALERCRLGAVDAL
ncbi:MAG TPA: hypothetical protein VI542_09880 [Candidatus Tectomicrobia bacterium]